MGGRGLLPRQQRFVEEYLVDLNASRAAVAAGYSERWAGVNADKLLKNTNVAKAVQEGMAARSARTEVTQDWVLRRYAMIAGVDKRQFFYDDGSLKPVSEWTEEMAAAVGSFDAVESGGGEGVPVVLKRLRFLDGKAALDSMARHLGMFKDKVEVSVDESLAERLERARSRLNDG